MNPSPTQPNSLAEEQASLWAARLDGGELSAADRTALNHWLDTDPAHRKLLSTYCQFSTDLELLLPSLPVASRIPILEAGVPVISRRRLLWLAALPLAAAAAFALIIWIGRPAQQFDRIATSAAQRQTVHFVDGSRAELNAQTSLQIEIGAHERRVRLASGQALFTVSRDPVRPFIVETPAGSVQVTGTVFAVRTETSHSLDVLVAEGSVQVRPAAAPDGRHFAPRHLAIGDQFSSGIHGLSQRTLSPVELENALAWRQGQVVFSDTTLVEALARFARYHGRGITASTDAAGLRLGGRYSLDDLDGFLAALEGVLPVQVTRNLNGTIQVSAVDAG